MKKSILFLGLLGAYFFSTAQTIGLRGGLNISRSITGIHVGGLVNFGQKETFSSQLEVSFSQFGAVEDDNYNGPEKLNYFKVAYPLKFHPAKNANLHAGPELGFQTNDIENSDDFMRSIDFGIIVGLEIFFLKNIGAGFRYYAGFRNDEDKYTNSAVQFSIIFLFNSKQLETFGH